MNTKNKTLAEKYEYPFACGSLDIDLKAIQKDQDYKNEITWWIFEDGSAIGAGSDNILRIRKNYGLHKDHEQLR